MTCHKVAMRVERIMRFLTSVFLLAVINDVVADIKTAFEESKIVPEIIDNAPSVEIEIKYGDQQVSLGNELTPTITKDSPEIHYKYENGVSYTLILTDPDTPTEGNPKEVKHWLIVNIPEDRVSEGQILTEYLGPAPPLGTGKHRYTFLLYKQSQQIIQFDEPIVERRGLNRFNFSAKKFAEKYNLEGPVAGNFLRAEHDDYVPIVYKELGFDNP